MLALMHSTMPTARTPAIAVTQAADESKGVSQPYPYLDQAHFAFTRLCSSDLAFKAPPSARHVFQSYNIETAQSHRRLPQQLLPSCIGTYARKPRVYTCPYIDI